MTADLNPSLFQDWKPQGEVVVDSNGNPVEGVEGWGNNPQQCGIRIISAEEVDLILIIQIYASLKETSYQFNVILIIQTSLRKMLETGT